MMTIAEILREEGLEEGIEKGIKEGIEVGIKEGIKEGLEAGIEKGETKALVRTAIKLLTKKFGPLSEELKLKISKLDAPTLDAIIEGILDYASLEEDVEKHFWQPR